MLRKWRLKHSSIPPLLPGGAEGKEPPMSDTSKTIRSFQCRDTLWDRFEQMARELECSVDYLVNDAMKQYARQRGYGGSAMNIPPSRTSMNPPLPPAQLTNAAPPPPPPNGGF